VRSRQEEIAALDGRILETRQQYEADQQIQTAAITQLQTMMQQLAENQSTLMEKLGVGAEPSENGNGGTRPEVISQNGQPVQQQ